MGIKDKWSEGVERTRQQNAAVEARRAERDGEATIERQRIAAERAKTTGLYSGAQHAWDEGSLCFIHTVRFEWTKVRDPEVTAEVHAILKIGWKLHSTAMTFVERTGMNNITCMFTFVR